MAVLNDPADDNTVLDWDATLAALASPTRRHLLAALTDNGGETTVATLARDVLTWQGGTQPAEMRTSHLDQRRASLHHTHLPKLVAMGLVTWSADEERVRLTEDALSHPVLLPIARWSRYPPAMPPSRKPVGDG
jgi:DNA-binding transcriptional ArsR family regulator